ncbi:MAG: hypothetical protein Q9162_005580 [Coniocarpon cinnabarinum]
MQWRQICTAPLSRRPTSNTIRRSIFVTGDQTNIPSCLIFASILSKYWLPPLQATDVLVEPVPSSRVFKLHDTSIIAPAPYTIQLDAVPSSSKTIIKAKGASSPATSNEQNYILNRLPELSHRFHRPSKEELLAAATGFWSRLRVRFKWFSIRSLRPFNIDDISAFVTWTLAGHLIWILVGTTTFCSLLIFAVNTVFAQETLAGWIGNYLTKSSGIKVVFESAVVPTWKDGVITFNNVFVSRRPGQGKANVSKGSSSSAAAIAAAAKTPSGQGEDEEDTNYTQFDVSIESVNVTLSFAKWFNGHGMLKDVSMRGVRGVVDRTSVHYPDEYVDPKTYRHEPHTGDFELESFKLDDLLVSVHQPRGFRPFSVSIFSADLPQLRKQWLFYDLLSANNMSGSFDGSAFFIHPRQLHSFTGATLPTAPSPNAPPGQWKKQSRVRVDGLNIDHLNRGIEGPFGWIQEGNVDIVADVMFPDNTDASLAKVVQEFYDKLEESVSKSPFGHPLPSTSRAMQSNANDVPSSADSGLDSRSPREAQNWLVMDMRVHLNDVQANIPLFTPSLSYVNNALVRPIVAYINSQRAFIPITCRVVKPHSDFEGSWTVYDSGLMEDVSKEVYDAFAEGVADQEKRMQRIKKVGWWGLQVLVQAVVVGLAGNVA